MKILLTKEQVDELFEECKKELIWLIEDAMSTNPPPEEGVKYNLTIKLDSLKHELLRQF
ncbi:MAG: hypothetical protein ACOX8A_08325 [Thermacetogeniaceae bacterium]|jgi:hypothetical protein